MSLDWSAAVWEFVGMVTLLLHNGATIIRRDHQRDVALDYAAKARNYDIFRLLRELNPAQITLQRHDSNPLDWWYQGNHLK